MRMKKPFNCEAKKKMFLSKWRKLKWLLFLTTVLLKAMFTLLIYSIVPLTTEGCWCLFFFCFFCEAVASIFGHNVFVYLMWWRKEKKNLPRCVLNQNLLYSFPVFVLYFYWKWKIRSMRDSYLFDKRFFGLIIISTCNMWLHAALA